MAYTDKELQQMIDDPNIDRKQFRGLMLKDFQETAQEKFPGIKFTAATNDQSADGQVQKIE